MRHIQFFGTKIYFEGTGIYVCQIYFREYILLLYRNYMQNIFQL